MEEMEFANRAQAEGTTVAHVADAVFSPLENTSVKDKKACEASVGFFLEEDSVLANYQAVYKLEKHGRTKAVMLRIAYQFFALRERLDSEINAGVDIHPTQVRIKVMQDDFVKWLTNMPGGNETW